MSFFLSEIRVKNQLTANYSQESLLSCLVSHAPDLATKRAGPAWKTACVQAKGSFGPGYGERMWWQIFHSQGGKTTGHDGQGCAGNGSISSGTSERLLKRDAENNVLLNPGDTFGGELLVEQRIDSGQMGVVYIGLHLRHQIRMAVKHPRIGDILQARLRKEAETWTGLGVHPFIACCYWVKEVNGFPAIFIEYVNGTTLKDWIRQGRCWDLATGIDMAIQICHGLEHAHCHGVIHRDIKPANILVDTRGNIKITDFGLAGGVAADTDSRPGVRAAGVGTPAYMSPEQWEDLYSLTPASDIFSLGVCMYEMFLGARPYESTRQPGHPKPVHALRGDMPAPLSELLLSTVAPAPGKRPQQVSQVREGLNAIYRKLFQQDAPSFRLPLIQTRSDTLNNQGVSYWELGRYGKAREFFNRAITLEPEHTEANFNLGNATRGLSHATLVARLRAAVCAIAVSPCSRFISAVAMDGTGILMETGPARPVCRLDKCSATAFSPTGSLLLGNMQGEVISCEPGGQAPCPVAKLHSAISAFACSSSPPLYAVADTSGNIMVVDTEKAGKYRLTLGQPLSVTALALCPGARRLAVGAGRGMVFLFDLDSPGSPLPNMDTGSAVTGLAFQPANRRLLVSTVSGDLLCTDYSLSACTHLFSQPHETNAICCSDDGRLLAMARNDGTIAIREAGSYGLMRLLQGHESAVTSLCFVPGSHLLISGGMDGAVMKWDSVTSCLLSPPLNHAVLMEIGAKIRAEAEALSGLLSSGQADTAVARALRLWGQDGFTITSPFHAFLFSAWQRLGAREIREARLIATLRHSGGTEATGACFSQEGESLVCAWADGLVQQLHIAAGDVGQQRSVLKQEQHARAVALGEDGTLFFSEEQACGGHVIFRLSAWAHEGGHGVGEAVIGPCPGPQRCVSLSRDGAVLAALVTQGMVITGTAPGACPASMHLLTDRRITCIAAGPRAVACSDGERAVSLVSPGSGLLLRQIRPPDPVCALAWSGNSRYLAIAGTECRITVWDTRKNVQHSVIGAGRDPVSLMAWSPDSRHLAAVDHQGLVSLVNVFTRATLYPAAAPGPATAVTWSPCGRYLAVACVSGRLMLYCLIPDVQGTGPVHQCAYQDQRRGPNHTSL